MGDRGLICLSAGVNGSTGDVRPLVTLGLALRARGFEIIVIGDGAFARSALAAGLAPSEWFSCCQVPQTFWLRTAAGQRGLWGERPRYRDRWLRDELAAHRRDLIERFWRRVGGPNNLRIVAAVGSITAVRMLRTFGPHCPKIVSCPMPYQPSAHFTMDPPDLTPLQRWRAWRQRNRPSADDQQFCEGMFHLVSASPTIFPRPEDWLPNMQVTGYVPFEDDHRDWAPSARLREFLAAGPPPVYVGFSSHAVLRGARGVRLARAIVDGCLRAGSRCLVQSADLPRSLESDRVFVLDRPAPHAALFPRCAAIVHHGGYGTTHVALAARRPMIIYPFQTDQFLWAARMGEMGVGPGFTARLRDLTADRLASDLAFVLDPGCRDRAAHWGAALDDERGLEVQVRAIESIIGHTRRGGDPVNWRMPAAPAPRWTRSSFNPPVDTAEPLRVIH
jgi:UDP:flavonoid glycosyltransferase YjiC (YdhE family)